MSNYGYWYHGKVCYGKCKLIILKIQIYRIIIIIPFRQCTKVVYSVSGESNCNRQKGVPFKTCMLITNTTNYYTYITYINQSPPPLSAISSLYTFPIMLCVTISGVEMVKTRIAAIYAWEWLWEVNKNSLQQKMKSLLRLLSFNIN